MREFQVVAKALSDPSRIRALMALQSGELCVCQIIELLGLAPSTVSKHMAVLSQAGLVEMRKEGRWVYYRPGGAVSPLSAGAIEWAGAALANDEQIRKDAEAIRAIKRIDKKKLCARYGRS